jgi:hypothetical protein
VGGESHEEAEETAKRMKLRILGLSAGLFRKEENPNPIPAAMDDWGRNGKRRTSSSSSTRCAA